MKGDGCFNATAALLRAQKRRKNNNESYYQTAIMGINPITCGNQLNFKK